MAPPDAGGTVADPALLATLRDWCEGRPARLLVASIAAPAGLDGAACVLDGSVELARLGRWRGLWWRLQILLSESLGLRRGIPWDCGWWRADAQPGAAASFRPRRPTLLMVREADAAASASLLSALHASSAGNVQPVRVLLVSATPIAGIERLQA